MRRGREKRIARGVAAALAVLAAGADAQPFDYSALEGLFGEAVTTSVTGSPQRESQVPAADD